MALREVLDIYDLMDDIHTNGHSIKEYLQQLNDSILVEVTRVKEVKGSTDFLKIVIPGKEGKTSGGGYPTLGIIGQLGGIGARPERLGFVSDGDGALVAVAVAAKLAKMQLRGDELLGDVIITTHICPTAPTRPHEPVAFMDSPVSMATNVSYTVEAEMDAILSIDTTKGNRVVNHNGFAISPTVKEGYILHVSDDLLQIMETSTGKLPVTFPLATQDITPYGNDLYHLNSILQPSTATKAPTVGVAITTEAAVPGCGTGASHEVDMAETVRFVLEVAKNYTAKKCNFYDEEEFARLVNLYGHMNHLRK